MRKSNIFGVELPIIQSPMAGVQDSALTIAVAKAGGLGSLPCAMLSAEKIEAELALITAASDKPFNLNFFCHQTPQPSAAREEQWRSVLAPYFEEFGIDSNDIPAGAARQPFSHAVADVLEPWQPPVVSFHFGLPEASLLQRVKGWGATVLSSATTVAEALWLEAHGADVIIAQGLEAGGHRGLFLSTDLTAQLGTLALLPQVVDRVQIPVVAAGGIADAAGVRAALSLGASAVQVGTAYLLCPEAKTSQVHREALKSANAAHTAITNIFSGRPARSIVNRSIRELGPIAAAVPEFPLAAAAITALRRVAERSGSGDFSPLWCGQNASGCREISATELTRLLASHV